MTYEKGSFGYDLEFVNRYQETILLQRDGAMALLAPAYQGRILTTSADGHTGRSFGWLNYPLIESGENAPHFNNYGGEERLWLGPEGGQYSIFFPPGAPFTFENWQVPGPIDNEAFEVVEHNDTLARFHKKTILTNYSGFQFVADINRTVALMSRSQIQTRTGITIPSMVKSVAYETINQLTNVGKMSWTRESGLLSIWMLGQLISSPTNVVLVPYIPGDEIQLGAIVNDEYFGKVPADRLIIRDNLLLFKADGLHRSKIGLLPTRARNYLGSYDYGLKVLTITFFNKPEEYAGYVNSMWEMQENPYGGDVINSYNDGPLEDGSQLGPFYELETSSPAALLNPGESITHTGITLHLSGDEALLEPVIKSLFGIDLNELKQLFAK